jgi:GNAT superfamily N-acetyltransferase
MVTIRLYTETDCAALFALLRSEGGEWSCYYDKETEYSQVLADCIVYLAVDGENIIGYIRCRNDGAFDIFVYDLLVLKSYRGNGLGKRLIGTVATAYSNVNVYMFSDADGYYEKQGFKRVGSIFCL